MGNNEGQVQRATDAIDRIFANTGVSREQTREDLTHVMEYLKTCLDALDGD